MSPRGRCVVCGGPEGQCQQEYLEMLITSKSIKGHTEATSMGETITASEHIYRDITSPDGNPQRELAYAPGDQIPVDDAKALGVNAAGNQRPAPAPKAPAAPPANKAKPKPANKAKAAPANKGVKPDA